jgi:hypothetical protein
MTVERRSKSSVLKTRLQGSKRLLALASVENGR